MQNRDRGAAHAATVAEPISAALFVTLQYRFVSGGKASRCRLVIHRSAPAHAV